MWDKLNTVYQVASTENKISVLTSFLNTFYQSVKNLGDYIVEVEIHFHKLSFMGLAVIAERQVTILLVPVMNDESIIC